MTRIFAELAERIGLPSIVGELVTRIALGIVLQGFGEFLPVLYAATQSDSYTSIVTLGMFFHPKVVDADVYERVEGQMSGITHGFLAQIFLSRWACIWISAPLARYRALWLRRFCYAS